jgi:hypothetical protein
MWRTWGPDLLAGELNINSFGEAVNIAPQIIAWILHQDEQRLTLADFDEHGHYTLTQLSLPVARRWR